MLLREGRVLLFSTSNVSQVNGRQAALGSNYRGSDVRYSVRKPVYRVVEKLLIEFSRLTNKRLPGDISCNKCKIF